MKKQIAFIIQRYGLEVNGGAELHCRLVAEKLSALYDVTVLTSCAKDYKSWANEYTPGESTINGVTIRRFATPALKNRKKFNAVTRLLYKKTLRQKMLWFLGLFSFYEGKYPPNTIENEEKWVKLQGPYLPGLVNYINENKDGYDSLIFFTYLYYPTIFGIRVAPEKSILVPTAHDEAPIYFNLFKPFFKLPAAILYNTLSEKRFVNALFDNTGIYSDIVGIGIDPPVKSGTSISTVIDTGHEYLVYIGRVNPDKGCQQLFDYFLTYKNQTNTNIKLVIVGELLMKVPADEAIITTGFINEDLKNALLLNAKALVNPSFYESLSLVALESMACGVPVIANERCEVLKDHIETSHAGFLYSGYDSFKAALNTLLNPAIDLSALSANGKRYVAENYTWPTTLKKYEQAISHVSRR